MRWDRIEQGWHQLTHHVCSRWGLLSEPEVQAMNGNREVLASVISQRYGLPSDQAEWQISTWQNAYSDRWLYEEPAEKV
jgi:uncharacterized protein YjbJ (UPF0337 family)